MSRDSLFGETIRWTGGPKDTTAPPHVRLVMGVYAWLAAIALAFAVVVSTGLHVAPSGLVTMAVCCSAVVLLAYSGRRFWRSGITYTVTDRHVIWRRGPIRRTIDRDSISYARIRWNAATDGVGDLVLVRAVPTGALRRTLSLTLADLDAPDRVWSIVRGVTPSASLGHEVTPLPQRLDEGERVLWSGTPLSAPWTLRRVLSAGLAGGVAIAAVRYVGRVVPALGRVAHLQALSGWTFAVFVLAVSLSALFLAGVAGGVGYFACFRPSRLVRATRYLVTNRRVLIRRGHEELSLDRSRIADVISAPTRRPLGDTPTHAGGLVDLFLVLDGPHARAFASSGAFQDAEGDTLLPVLSAIEDAETVGAILRDHAWDGDLATAA